MDTIALTDRELDLMSILWDRGSATAAEIRQHLSDPLAHTTILTVLAVMETKGYVRRSQEGRAHRYYPRVARADAARKPLSQLLRKVFRNSPALLLTQLVEDSDLSEEELVEMRCLLDEARKKGGV